MTHLWKLIGFFSDSFQVHVPFVLPIPVLWERPSDRFKFNPFAVMRTMTVANEKWLLTDWLSVQQPHICTGIAAQIGVRCSDTSRPRHIALILRRMVDRRHTVLSTGAWTTPGRHWSPLSQWARPACDYKSSAAACCTLQWNVKWNQSDTVHYWDGSILISCCWMESMLGVPVQDRLRRSVSRNFCADDVPMKTNGIFFWFIPSSCAVCASYSGLVRETEWPL